MQAKERKLHTQQKEERHMINQIKGINMTGASFFFVLWTACCAGGCVIPQYSQEIVPLGHPSIPFEQAWEICEPRAQMYADQSLSQSKEHLENLSSFSSMGPLLSITEEERIRRDAYHQYMRSCLASYGWKIRSVCIQNCN